MFHCITAGHVRSIPLFFLATRGNVARLSIATEQPQNSTQSDQNSASQDADERRKKIDELLRDSEVRTALLQRLSGSAVEGQQAFPPSLTLSGTAAGSGWPAFPFPTPFGPFPAFSPFWPPNPDQGVRPPGSAIQHATIGASSSPEDDGHQVTETEQEDDVIDYLSDAEALEFLEFDPHVSSEDAWEATKTMSDFLEKHFTRCLKPEDREAMLKDFPKPNSQALQVPKLDDQVKDHLKKKGINPHFGAERSLYRIQSQVLDMAGPLTCLWSDLLDTGVTIKREQIILLVQRSLILLGSLSNSITLERRRINWSKLNPALKDIPVEDDEEGSKATTLFGGGFMEKANKRLEEEKTLTKVAGLQRENPAAKRQRFSHDSSDLRSFLDKGAPAQYSGRRTQRQQLYTKNRQGQQTNRQIQQQPKWKAPQFQGKPPRKFNRQ